MTRRKRLTTPERIALSDALARQLVMAALLMSEGDASVLPAVLVALDEAGTGMTRAEQLALTAEIMGRLSAALGRVLRDLAAAEGVSPLQLWGRYALDQNLMVR